MKNISLKGLILVFLVINVLTIFDLFYDYATSAHPNHLILDQLVVLATSIALGFLIAVLMRKMKEAQEQASSIRVNFNHVSELKNKLQQGIGEIIGAEFKGWQFSSSEQDVAMLLIKGLSLRQIAEIRNCKESTVRQHANNIYKKSNLKGRRELSAYFLEDFLDRNAPHP